MKKMRFAAAVLIAALLISTFALADVVATDNIKMRRGAGTNYGVITGIPAGTHMQYLDEVCGEDGEVRWYKIKYQGKEGQAAVIQAPCAVPGRSIVEVLTVHKSTSIFRVHSILCIPGAPVQMIASFPHLHRELFDIYLIFNYTIMSEIG